MSDQLPPSNQKKVKQGLVIVHTGDGKGKTTAAMGLIFRAMGHGLRVCVLQFIKNEGAQWGEIKMARQLGIEWHREGDGFTWTSSNLDDSKTRALQGWHLAQEKIKSEDYDLILLDEFTYTLIFGWLKPLEVIEWLKINKPEKLHLVITGRNAPQPLLDYADLVTEMKAIKHPYDRGVPGQLGIEF